MVQIFDITLASSKTKSQNFEKNLVDKAIKNRPIKFLLRACVIRKRMAFLIMAKHAQTDICYDHGGIFTETTAYCPHSIITVKVKRKIVFLMTSNLLQNNWHLLIITALERNVTN